METTALDAPEGIDVRLGWAPESEETMRLRTLAREAIADRLDVDVDDVSVEITANTGFGHNARLAARVAGSELPLRVHTASFRTASVVAVSGPDELIGLDIRDHQPAEATIREIRTRSRLWGDSLWEQASTEKLLLHWSRVQAVRQADPRGVGIAPEAVRLDPPFGKAWVPDRHGAYRIVDLSSDGFIVTLAHAPATVAMTGTLRTVG